MTRNQLFSLFGFGNYSGIVLPEADGALDSIGEFQQLIGLYALDAESGTSTTTPSTPADTGDEDTHSWFAVAPGLLPIGSRAALRGQLLKTLPAAASFWKVVPVPIRRPRLRAPQPLQIIVPPQAIPDIPPPLVPLLGVGRSVLMVPEGFFDATMEDMDEVVLLVLTAELQPDPPRRYLVQRSVVDAEWAARLRDMAIRT